MKIYFMMSVTIVWLDKQSQQLFLFISVKLVYINKQNQQLLLSDLH